jgi:hypothetical protein
MRGLKRLRSAQVISAGHALVQNLRRGHYELVTDVDTRHQLTTGFAELALAISSRPGGGPTRERESSPSNTKITCYDRLNLPDVRVFGVPTMNFVPPSRVAQPLVEIIVEDRVLQVRGRYVDVGVVR